MEQQLPEAGKHKKSADWWAQWKAANGLGLAMLAYLSLSALLASLWGNLGYPSGSAAVREALRQLRYVIALLVPFLGVGWALTGSFPRRLPRQQADPVRRWTLPAVLAAVLAGIGTACVGNLLTLFMQWAAGKHISVYGFSGRQSLSYALVSFLSYTVLAAVVEEVSFRGVALQLLRPWGDLWALVMSSLIFALCHSSALQFFPALLGGGLFALLAISTGDLRLSMLVHMCYNATALLLNRAMMLVPLRMRLTAALVLWFGLALVGVVSLLLLRPWLRVEPVAPEASDRRGVYSAPLLLLGISVMIWRAFHEFLGL